ncbi:MAG: hypothetical protein H0W19_07730 [Nitrosopumilus sp.]|nr:hypothetical protein [Nitrosopumilus sp.]
MNKFALLIFLGILIIVVSFHSETLLLVASQSSIENSFNLTYPNNPTLTIGEMLNRTSVQGNNSNESDNNLPSPM